MKCQSSILGALFLSIAIGLIAGDAQAQPTLMYGTNKLPADFFFDHAATTDSSFFPPTNAFRSRWKEPTPGRVSLWMRAVFPSSGNLCLFSRIGETVRIYYTTGGKTVLSQNGRYVPPITRSVAIDSRQICVNDVTAGDTFYIHIPSFSYLSDTKFILTGKEETVQRAERSTQISFVIMGAILIIVTCSFTIFIIFRDLSYLWFSIYIICAYLMSNLDLLGYLFGNRFPKLFLDDKVLQIYFVTCPISLIGLCISFFKIFSRSLLWTRIFIALLIFSVVCLATIPLDSVINSQLILWFNLTTVALVALYAGLSYFGNNYLPGGIFLLAFILPIITSILIALDFLTVFETRSLGHVGGLALLVQSVILFIGVVKRYDRMNADLIRVTLTKWEKEHEAKIFQLRNTELISQNEIIENQKSLLAEQAEKLEEMNTTKDKLLSVLSHDLRAPIGNLRAVLSLLSKKAITNEEFYEISQKLRSDVDGAYHLLDDVLHWVRSQYSGIVPKPVKFGLMEVIRDVCQVAMPMASEKMVKIKLTTYGDDSVYADKDQVQIIVRNLVNNAIKYSNPSTDITVIVEHRGEFVEVRVQDKGVGMPQKTIDKVLQGVKVESSRGTKGEKGTGLGLLLCREFVALNGGTLEIKSRVGDGTVVSFTLRASGRETE